MATAAFNTGNLWNGETILICRGSQTNTGYICILGSPSENHPGNYFLQDPITWVYIGESPSMNTRLRTSRLGKK